MFYYRTTFKDVSVIVANTQSSVFVLFYRRERLGEKNKLIILITYEEISLLRRFAELIYHCSVELHTMYTVWLGSVMGIKFGEKCFDKFMCESCKMFQIKFYFGMDFNLVIKEKS